jgi:N6-adenosine-specific RNA methylase IME4
MNYGVVYVDPPWDYKGQRQHAGKANKDTGGALSHYSTIPLSKLKTLNLKAICASDCVLYMWVTNPHLAQGISLMDAWGFKYATVAFVWDKVRVNPGHYTMSQCELCLVGKIGKIPQPRGLRNVRQFVSEKRTKHSKKPDEVRYRIEQLHPYDKKVELFARQKNIGWDVIGNEINGKDIFEVLT